MRLTAVLAILGMTLVGGCEQRPNIGQVNRYLTEPPQQVDVKLGPHFASLVDWYHGLADHVSFPTGKLAQQIFTGKETCSWTMEVISSSLDASDAANYQISCVLRGPGRQTTLSAGGSGQALLSTAKATTAAVETSLKSLAVQARVYMENPK
jgi:hypothetical protein